MKELIPVTRREKILDAIATEIDSPITPVTREEKILVAIADKSNIDFTPATREEYFMWKVLRSEWPSALVEFVSAYGLTIVSKQYAAYDGIDFPPPSSRYGYEFLGWNLTEEQIQQKIKNGEDHIVVSPVFRKNESDKKYITVSYKDNLHEPDYYEAYLSDSIRLTAAEIPGYQFSCWKSSDGYVLSNEGVYTIKTADSTEIIAEYVPEGEEVVHQPIIAMTGITTSVNGTKNNIVFMATSSFSDDYTAVKQGIIHSNTLNFPSDDLYNRLVIDGEGTKKYEEALPSSDHLTYSLNMGSHTDTMVYGRAFMILENGAGEQTTIYSENILSGSFDSLSEQEGN